MNKTPDSIDILQSSLSSTSLSSEDIVKTTIKDTSDNNAVSVEKDSNNNNTTVNTNKNNNSSNNTANTDKNNNSTNNTVNGNKTTVNGNKTTVNGNKTTVNGNKTTVKTGNKNKIKEEKSNTPQRIPYPIKDINENVYGDLPLIQSKEYEIRSFMDIKKQSMGSIDNKIWLRGRIHSMRAKGKTVFLQIRQGIYTIQVVGFAFNEPNQPTIDMIKYISKQPQETIVDIYGTIKKTNNKITSCTQQDMEINIERLYSISIPNRQLPFQLADANRYDINDKGDENDENTSKNDSNGIDEQQLNIRVQQKIRLDNRYIDLRTFANNAIFTINSRICQYVHEYLTEKNFIEIHTPKILPGVSEGGAAVFKVQYFNRTCCLAQSPQQYKQMAIASDLHRVFEIGPVFRAEDANTHRHMCEFTGIDFEMEIKSHYHEILDIVSSLFITIFNRINKECSNEQAIIEKQYPFIPLQYPNETIIITHYEAVNMLKESGEIIDYYDDFTTPQEKLLGILMKKKYQTDFYIIDKYPSSIRPFYTMPCYDDIKYSNSYDVFIRGEEITSGAQRIHDADMLSKRAIECGIPIESISSYINCFRYGVSPHGGAGIGLERVVMLFLGLNNIRKTSLFPRLPNRVEP